MALLSNRIDTFDKILTELMEVAPDNLDVMKLEVASAQKRRDDKAALKLLETLFAKEPTTSNVIALAAHRQSVGDGSGAIVQLQHWFDEHADDVKVRDKLAEIYGSNNKVGGVVYQYRKILEVEPEHVIALNNLAWQLLDDDPKQALAYAEKANTLSPNTGPILDTLAMAQMKNNNIISARKSIDRARALFPESPEMRFHEAQVLAAEGDATSAIDAMNSLLAHYEKFSERAEAEAFLKQLK
jgi:Flp pilus assembly protein TadD